LVYCKEICHDARPRERQIIIIIIIIIVVVVVVVVVVVQVIAVRVSSLLPVLGVAALRNPALDPICSI